MNCLQEEEGINFGRKDDDNMSGRYWTRKGEWLGMRALVRRVKLLANKTSESYRVLRCLTEIELSLDMTQ